MVDVEGLEKAISILSGKWSVRILFSAKRETQTFTYFKNDVDGISNKMLSKTLRKLEKKGLVNKAESADGYILTEKGEKLRDALRPVAEWAETYESSANQVLVVEDDKNQADLYGKWLENYEVKNNKIDDIHEESEEETVAVLLDRELEGKKSRNYLKYLNAIDLPVIILTGLEPGLEIAEMEIQDYIVKPVSKEVLRQKIKEMEVLKDKNEDEKLRRSLKSRKEILESRIANKKLENSEKYEALKRQLEELESV